MNALGFTHRDYEGSVSTLCAGCGHDSISAAIIQACFELDLPPHRIAKLSGIGCSSKTPTYFLGQSHGFNSVHGRMPSVATGASLANRDLDLSRRLRRRRFGLDRPRPVRPLPAARRQHGLHRREQRRLRPDQGPVLGDRRRRLEVQEGRRQPGRADRPGLDGDPARRDLRGAQLLRRQGPAGAADQGRRSTIAASAFLDVISPCVAFNNHPGSTKSFDYVREHNDAVNALDVMIGRERDHRRTMRRARSSR